MFIGNKLLDLIIFLENLSKKRIGEIQKEIIDILNSDEKKVVEAIIYLYENHIPYDEKELKDKIKEIMRNLRTLNPEFIILTENDPRMSYEEAFKRHGYDYKLISSWRKGQLEKYAKEDDIEYVLSFIDKCLTEDEKEKLFTKWSELPIKGEILIDLMIYFDKEGIDTILKLKEQNDFKLSDMRGSNFFKEGRKYISKKVIYNPEGDLDSFTKYLEGTKEANNKETITSEVVEVTNKCFEVPIERALENTRLIDLYGIKCPLLENGKSTLNGKHTQYILDRCIELGLVEYVVKHPKFLMGTNFPFKYYKLKRALDLGETIYKNGGLRKELSNDTSDYNEISWTYKDDSQLISQNLLTKEELNKGKKTPKGYYNSDGNSLEKVFGDYYKYNVYDPKRIIRCNIGNKTYFDTREQILQAFSEDYKFPIETSYGRNQIVNMLDQYFKTDNRTYKFIKQANTEWPDVEILISRPKVIRLCELLSKKEMSINLESPIIEDIIVSILVKDSILSENELSIIRESIKKMLQERTKTNESIVEFKLGYVGETNDRFLKR